MIKVVLFDFDGTLAQTMLPALKIANRLAPEYNLKKISLKEAEKLKDLGAKEIIKLYKIPFYKVPQIVLRIRKELSKELPKIKAFPGIKEVLTKLKKRNMVLGIVTSNSKENVEQFLKNNGILEIDFIYSELNFFGKGKVIKNLLKKRKINPKTALYVGDEVRDVEAARNGGVKVVAVSWGYNSRKKLHEQKPDFLKT